MVMVNTVDVVLGHTIHAHMPVVGNAEELGVDAANKEQHLTFTNGRDFLKHFLPSDIVRISTEKSYLPGQRLTLSIHIGEDIQLTIPAKVIFSYTQMFQQRAQSTCELMLLQ